MLVLKNENTERSQLIAENNIPAMKDYIVDLEKMLKTIQKEIRHYEKWIENHE